MSDMIRRADAIEALQKKLQDWCGYDCEEYRSGLYDAQDIIEALPSAEPNWTCTANFIAEQLERLKDMTDEERRDFLIRFFSSSAEAVQGEWIRKEREYNDCDGHSVVYWYECDQCGARPPKDTWKNEWHSDYCPSCGARMYKGGDSE